MSIRPLPWDIIARIRSSIVLTSLNGAVCGLLQNSLDASASKINVSVNYSRGDCSVEDDGIGIPPESFHENGGLGELHCTSRYPPRPDCHGRHGEFLASLAALSLLTIASHHRDYRSHNCLTIHNSKVVARNTPALPEQRVLSFASGTRVTVRDLFGSMPVRVKQRAIEMERLRSTKSFDQLLFTCVAFLLAWPGGVRLSLRDVMSNRTVVLRTSEMTREGQNHRSPAIEILTRTPGLLAQATLLEREDAKSWVSIGASAPGISVSGCVCLVPVATKRVQFIALGIQPLIDEHQSNILYEEVNRVFSNSSFGVLEEIELDDEGMPKTDGFTAKELKPKRGIDRWPMFFICINLADEKNCLNTNEFLDESHHNLAIITDLLQVMAYEFLKKHHFRPKVINAFDRLKPPKDGPSKASRSLKKAPSSASSETGTRRESGPRPSRLTAKQSRSSTGSPVPRNDGNNSPSPFSSWSRVKSSSFHKTDKGFESRAETPRDVGSAESKRVEAPKPPRSTSPLINPLFDKTGNLIRKPFNVASDKQSQKANESIVWTNPETSIRSLLDARTGFMVKTGKKKTIIHGQEAPKPPSRTLLPLGKPAKGSAYFQPVEPSIPRLPEISASTGDGQAKFTHDCHGDLRDIHLDLPNGAGVSMPLQSRISKDALRDAEIIGQVDKKFILAKVATMQQDGRVHAEKPERRLLILIDQHAADERCRVEDLMRSYFHISDEEGRSVARSERIDKPLRFDLSRQDGELLVRFQRHFEYWGVFYDVLDPEETAQHQESMVSRAGVTIEVHALPPNIFERCRVEPRVLAEMLRKEIWRLHDNPGLPVSGRMSRTTDELVGTGCDDDWVPRFHDCPEGILELINSRSCRSAIMFNDFLSKDQCVDLAQRLAGCAFPFQCAHGRPSMVPLVDLGMVGRAIGLGGLFSKPREEEGVGGLLRDVKRWSEADKGGGNPR
ncbi:putative MLH3 protein [Apodospora peruviana]|uniref:MLH3 protein n=1 Tax=Apodospora peruviana TaxID=516989 RepID=A0AAE0HZ20_9PEZI|nr:putative MLH3 protein [Apodospora peruviana]